MLQTYNYRVTVDKNFNQQLEIELDSGWSIIGCPHFGINFNTQGTVELSTYKTDESHTITIAPCGVAPGTCKKLYVEGHSVYHVHAGSARSRARDELVKLLEEHKTLYAKVQ